MEPIIRKETPRDYRAVETMTRNAFYNIYVPGCIEHYLVHTMRSHEDFIPELDFVLELDGQVIGNIMYTRAALLDEHGGRKEILTFGPLCIAPAYQRLWQTADGIFLCTGRLHGIRRHCDFRGSRQLH